jgi:hypothetical protein
MGGLLYVEHRPRPELRPHVECLWLASDPRARRRAPERVVPDGCPELIVHLLDRFARRDGGRFVVQPRAGRERDGELARHFTCPGRLRLLFAGE